MKLYSVTACVVMPTNGYGDVPSYKEIAVFKNEQDAIEFVQEARKIAEFDFFDEGNGGYEIKEKIIDAIEYSKNFGAKDWAKHIMKKYQKP